MDTNTTKKKGRKALKIILYTLAIIIVALLVLIPFLMESVQDAMEQKASLLNGTVKSGNISLSVSGAGTLTDAEGIELTLPKGIELTEYLVSEGDMVSKGDLLARIDRTSVMQAIDAVQETMDYLSEQLTKAEEGSSTQTVSANTAGRLKAVYASAGDNVQEVMLKNGCLAVMSIDGTMAVQVPADGLAEDDSLTVTLSDGTQLTGTVDAIRNNTATVLISDEYGSIGEEVSVSDAEGKELAKAELYVHSEWRAVAYTGTVDKVRSTEGKTVRSGAVLFNLKDTLTTATYDSLVSQRREYEDMMQRLFEMYMNGGLTAPCDGIVGPLDEDLIGVPAGEDDDSNSSSSSSSSAASGYTGSSGFSGFWGLASTGTEEYKVELLASNYPDRTPDDGASYNNMSGMVTSVNRDMTYNMILGDPYTVTDYKNLPTVATDASSMYISSPNVSCDPGMIFVLESGEFIPTDVQVGDVFLITYGGGSVKWMIKVGHNDIPGDGGNGGNGGSMGGFGGGGFSFGGSSSTGDFELFTTEETVAASVIPPEKMTVTITVDELDILLLSKGMEAQVTIDALPGQSFPGTLTSIDTTASNSGGNTKFTAEITVDRNGYMLSGMNAGVMFVTDEKRSIPVIPAEALYEEGSKTIVYTGWDADNECLINPVEVETGVSDGSNVEILSGLSTGDMYWYTYLDTLDIYSMFSR